MPFFTAARIPLQSRTVVQDAVIELYKNYRSLYTMSKSMPSKQSKDFAEQRDKFRSTLDSAFLVVVNEGALGETARHHVDMMKVLNLYVWLVVG